MSLILNSAAMNEFFYELTPERVLSAAETAGFTPTGHCLVLNSLENRVFDLKLEDESHIIIKFYRPGRWSREQIQEEHDFLFDLAEAEIPACIPLVMNTGQTISETAGIFFSIWPRTGGRAPDELSDQELFSLGRLLARIHNVGEKRSTQHRPAFSVERMALQPLDYLIQYGFLPEHLQERYRNCVLRTVDIYETLYRADFPGSLLRIHGDAHRGNLLKNESWFFLDFDDFCMGPAVQDLWLLAAGQDEEGLRQRQLLLEGYQQMRDFDPLHLRLIEPIRALRFIHYAYWIARRYEDPAFLEAFPAFHQEDYWEKETLDLEKQVLLYKEILPETHFFFSQNSGTSPLPEEDRELSNKDFFWDWEESDDTR